MPISDRLKSIREALALPRWEAPKSNHADPFAPAALRQAPAKSAVPIPDFRSIPRDEMEIVKAIGHRAHAMLANMQATGANIVTPPWAMCACDVAVAHLQRPLRLDKFLQADDLAFLNAYMFIASRINRLTFQIDGLQNHPYAKRGALR